MGNEKKSTLPQGLLGRSTELVGLLTKIGSKNLGEKLNLAKKKVMGTSDQNESKADLLRSQIEQAKLVAESFGRLKGAAMKVGQMLSVEGRDLLPPAVVEVLSKLQDQSPPLPFSELKKVLLEDLGIEKMGLIDELNEKALAAASIGQVHRARYKNQDIVLKIQYPGIAEAVDSDLALLRRIVSGALNFSSRSIDFHPLFDELQSVLKAEVDYQKEASNFDVYNPIIKNIPSLRLPKVISELSSPRVLAMTYEPGLKLDAYKSTSPSKEERLHYGHLFLNLFIEEFINRGFVQTDPNFANFLFRPADKSLIILDLGACKQYSKDFVRKYCELMICIMDRDFKQILERSVDLEFIKDSESPECLDLYFKMLVKGIEPFEESHQPFDYTNNNYADEVRALTMRFLKEVRYSAPPHRLIFLNRKLGGLFQMLKALEVQINLRPYWEKIVASIS